MFKNLTVDGFMPNGLSGLLFSVVMVAFAFGGSESVAYTAGEAKDVKKTMPRAVNGVFWSIVLFYLGSTFVILCMWPWDKMEGVGSPLCPRIRVVRNSGSCLYHQFCRHHCFLERCKQRHLHIQPSALQPFPPRQCPFDSLQGVKKEDPLF